MAAASGVIRIAIGLFTPVKPNSKTVALNELIKGKRDGSDICHEIEEAPSRRRCLQHSAKNLDRQMSMSPRRKREIDAATRTWRSGRAEVFGRMRASRHSGSIRAGGN